MFRFLTSLLPEFKPRIDADEAHPAGQTMAVPFEVHPYGGRMQSQDDSDPDDMISDNDLVFEDDVDPLMPDPDEATPQNKVSPASEATSMAASLFRKVPQAEPKIVESEKGVRFKSIPVSDFIANDPMIKDLNPFLKMQPEAKRPEEYTLFRTLAQKHKLDLEEPKLKGLMEYWEKGYAEYIKHSRIFVSYENQFPGFRRLIISGDNLSSKRNAIPIIAVNADGALISKTLMPNNRDVAPLKTVAEVLEVIYKGHPDWQISHGRGDIELNRHSNSARATALEGLEFLKSGGLYSMLGVDRTSRRVIDDKLRPQIKHMLKNKADSRLNLMRWAIADAMNPEVLRIMRGTGLTKLGHAQWLCGTHGSTLLEPDTINTEAAIARQQAVKSYPILARSMHEEPTLRDAIDARVPLAPVMAKFLRCDVKDVKRLQGLTWQRAGASPRDPMKEIKTLLKLPHDRLPTSRKDHRFLKELEKFGKGIFMTSLPETMQRVARDGDPYKMMDKILATPAEQVKDAVNYLANTLYVPATMNKIREVAEERGLEWNETNSERGYASNNNDYVSPSRKALEAVLEDFKISELLELSTRFHRNIHRYADKIQKISTDEVWEPLVGEIDLGNGRRARELNSAKALTKQGRSENHCVGGYLDAVLKGRSKEARIIFSIESEDKIWSTVELDVMVKPRTVKNDDGSEREIPSLHCKVRQNYAYRNSEPDQASEEAAKRLAKHIQSLEIQGFSRYTDGLTETRHQQEMINLMPLSVRSAGYNPWDREHLQDAWDELSYLLPRKIRKSGLDKFIAGSDIKGEEFKFVEGSDAQNIWDRLAVEETSDLELEETQRDEVDDPFLQEIDEAIEETEQDIIWAAQ
jgi:hypothetical protein